jgi:hypothetical protein
VCTIFSPNYFHDFQANLSQENLEQCRARAPKIGRKTREQQETQQGEKPERFRPRSSGIRHRLRDSPERARAAWGHMSEHRLPTSTLAAAGPRRHSRRPRRRCRLLLLPAFALALLSLAYLSFSSHSSLPLHGELS